VVPDDLGEWNFWISAEDVYGNAKSIETQDIRIVESKLSSYFIRYWYVTVISISLGGIMIAFFGRNKLLKRQIQRLHLDISTIEQLKKRNAIMYFSKGDISRDTYDRLHQEYESKLAHLSKKQRLLNRKMEKIKQRWRNV
jgi:hypothetical protein